MMNKRGARHDPCGTQRFKISRYGRDPLMETRWLLLAKYDLNHSKATPHIPNSLFRHVSRTLQLTVSKTALRSSMTSKVTSWVFIFMRISFVTMTKPVSVLWFWRYDDWNSGYGKWFIIMVVYLFNHRLLSQLGERLQVTDRFAVLT